jgi:hypothetical protein
LDDGVFVRDLDLGKKVKILDDADQPLVVAVELSNDEETTTDVVTEVAAA